MNCDDDSPKEVIKQSLFNVLRSSLFWAAYVAIFRFVILTLFNLPPHRYMICFFKNRRRKIDRWNIILSAFFSTFAIFFEPSHRRTELALYFIPRFFEAILSYLQSRGLFKSFEYSEVFLFSIAMGIIMFFYQNEEKNLNSTYLSIYKRFWN